MGFKFTNKGFSLLPNEEVKMIIRPYFGVVVGNFTMALLTLVLDFFLMFYLFSLGWWGATAFLAIVFLVFFYIIRLWFLWNNNYVLVTDQRLIDCERFSFFRAAVTTVALRTIRHIVVGRATGWRNWFRIGQVIIEINNQENPYIIYNVKNPEQVLMAMNRLVIVNQTSGVDDKV